MKWPPGSAFEPTPAPSAGTNPAPGRLQRLRRLGLGAGLALVLMVGAGLIATNVRDLDAIRAGFASFGEWAVYGRLVLVILLLGGWRTWLALFALPAPLHAALVAYRWRFALWVLVFEGLFEHKLLAELFRRLAAFVAS